MRTEPTVQHVDMDAFFASVELLERPDLAGKPVIVGGSSSRGVVASCNYEARRFGIRSAMSSVRAKALCPDAVFLQGEYGKYEHYSARFMNILGSFSPVVEPVSVDEAFVDVAGAGRLFGTPVEIATSIRNAVFDGLGLHVSVGSATTKHLAKLASESAKPKAGRSGIEAGSGVRVIEKTEELEFLHALPVRAIWGVGPRTADKLERLGIVTVGQLAHFSHQALEVAIGNHGARHLVDLAWNHDDRDVVPSRAAKSIGHEQTFAHDLQSPEEVHLHIMALVDAVSARMRKAGVGGRTVTVKIRFADFVTITRSATVDKPTATSTVIAATALRIATGAGTGNGVRLLGVSVSNLSEVETAEQMPFAFDDTGGQPGNRCDDRADRDLDHTIDEIRDRYGASSVVPALLVRDGEPRILRPGDRQWGPTENDEKQQRDKSPWAAGPSNAP